MATWSSGSESAGGRVRWEDAPGRHAACDAQIAALRGMAEAGAVLAKHLNTIMDALNAVMSSAAWESLRERYAEAMRDLESLPEGIAKYDCSTHNEAPEIRYVSSSDSAASGDEISG